MERVRVLLVVFAILASVLSTAGSLSAQQFEPKTIQAIYAVPSDVAPVAGRLPAAATSISVVQDWFAGQTNGRYPVFNEVNGSVDVEQVVLSKTRAQIQALDRGALSTLLIDEVEAAVPASRTAEIFVYLEAPQGSGGVCGYSGSIVVIIMDNCGTYPSINAQWPYGDTYLVAHELTHLLGAVASCAPNAVPGGHLSGDNRDILYQGPDGRDWNNLMLDPGNDDYFDHGRADCADIADSPVLGTWESNGPDPQPPSTAWCDGLEATVIGTAGNDTLIGTPGTDVIAGLQGNDTIRGLGGDDVICGGMGDDQIYGGQGFDIIFGAQGDDLIYAADGASSADRADVRGARMFGGAGNDVIHGSARWDRMQGGAGVDRLFGYEGREWIRGGGENDVIDGGANLDDLHGGNGNDTITLTDGDTVRGGAGAKDRCILAPGAQPTLRISCELS